MKTVNDNRFHSQRPDAPEYHLTLDKTLKDNFTFHYINQEVYDTVIKPWI